LHPLFCLCDVTSQPFQSCPFNPMDLDPSRCHSQAPSKYPCYDRPGVKTWTLEAIDRAIGANGGSWHIARGCDVSHHKTTSRNHIAVGVCVHEPCEIASLVIARYQHRGLRGARPRAWHLHGNLFCTSARDSTPVGRVGRVANRCTRMTHERGDANARNHNVTQSLGLVHSWMIFHGPRPERIRTVAVRICIAKRRTRVLHRPERVSGRAPPPLSRATAPGAFGAC
jgi:hypothetical protein